MKTPAAPNRSETDSAILLAGLVAICCGGPLLLAASAATGLGAWLIGQGGALLAALTMLGAAILGLLWIRRSGRIGEADVSDCCNPVAPTEKERT